MILLTPIIALAQVSGSVDPYPTPPMATVAQNAGNTVRIENLNLSGVLQDWGSPEKDKSVGQNPLKVAGKTYSHGLGTHAVSHFVISLNKAAIAFKTQAGVDDEATDAAAIIFEILVDGKVAAKSPLMKKGMDPWSANIDLRGAKHLELKVLNGDLGIDYDHADWLEPVIETLPDKASMIKSFVPPPEPIPVLGNNFLPKPEIHGPTVYGCSPNKPFLYRIPCSGERPIRFSAAGLPSGLKLDPKTGIITGEVHHRGNYKVELSAHSRRGTSHRSLTVKANGLLSLTPPMGWNSWNVWAGDVDQAKVLAAGEELRKTGLADFGYDYVNIDDTWEADRDADGNILSNSKFPSMKGLTASVHKLGLKVGLYSSPGPKTCAGFTASYQHEKLDADQYAAWGFDYLKYDWCSYGGIEPHPDLAGYQKPYRLMSKYLLASPRDIVFSLCQYGMGDVWNWGRSVGGNLWRCTGDINDSWGSMSANAFGASAWAKGAGPGGWNDPDMLVVGKLGWGGKPRATRLTPNEQVTHISMWSLLAAPLILGCDLTQIDHWTLELLTNPDVIDVDQDQLGRPAVQVEKSGDAEIWARPLADGGWAVGLINRGDFSQKITCHFSKLNVKGRHEVRNLWLRKNLGKYASSFSANVPRHGTTLIKILK